MYVANRLMASLVGVALLGVAGVATAQTDQLTWAIRNVRVFDGERVAENRTVLLQGRLIGTVGAGNMALPEGAVEIDGTGKTLMPGLIDSHTHVVDSFSANSGRSLLQASAYGITTVVDLGANNRNDYVVFRRAAGNSAFPGGADMRTAGPGLMAGALKSAAEASAWVAWHKQGGADFIKIFAPTSLAADPNIETMNAVTAAAKTAGLITVAHSTTEAVSRRLVEGGLKGLVHLSNTADSADFGSFLAKAGVFQSTNIVGAAPAAYRQRLASDADLQPYMPAFMVEGLKGARNPQQPARFQAQVANFKAMQKAGVLLLAGTDGVYPYQPLLHAELEILSKEGGLSPVEALKTATSNPAQAYGLNDRGRIAEGLRADVVLLNGDPTKNILDARRIEMVFINGTPVDREYLREELSRVAPPPGGATPAGG